MTKATSENGPTGGDAAPNRVRCRSRLTKTPSFLILHLLVSRAVQQRATDSNPGARRVRSPSRFRSHIVPVV